MKLSDRIIGYISWGVCLFLSYLFSALFKTDIEIVLISNILLFVILIYIQFEREEGDQ